MLYIISYFWNNIFYWSVQGMGIASFICDIFHLIDTWLFFSLNQNNRFDIKNFEII